LIDTYGDGTAFVIGVISTWAPPRQLVLSWRHESFPSDRTTQLHDAFEPIEAGPTCLTVEHVGGDAIPAGHASRHNFTLAIFQLRLADWRRRLLQAAFPPG
jgi:hypothetical protein